MILVAIVKRSKFSKRRSRMRVVFILTVIVSFHVVITSDCLFVWVYQVMEVTAR